jgi:hypothetical protein
MALMTEFNYKPHSVQETKTATSGAYRSTTFIWGWHILAPFCCTMKQCLQNEWSS